MSFTREDVQLLAEESAYKGFFQIKTLKLKHRLFAGGWTDAINRELFIRGDAVGVLPYDPDRDEVCLVEQFRVGVYAHDDQPWITELIAGMVEVGEAVEDVALREAQEEAGCALQQLLPISAYYSSPGGCSEYINLFCGKARTEHLGGIHGLDHEAEDIRVVVMSFDDAMAQLNAGKLNNAHTIIALQWLALHKDVVRAAWA